MSHDQVAELAWQEPVQVKNLAGGISARTELLTYGDGRKLIRKSAHNTDDHQVEVEASHIGHAIGAPVPAVVHDPRSPGDLGAPIFMEYMEANTAVRAAQIEAGTPPYSDSAKVLERIRAEAIESDGGRLLGVLDLTIVNDDRHSNNWLVDGRGNPIGIDHGQSLDPENDAIVGSVDDEFPEAVGFEAPPMIQHTPFSGHFHQTTLVDDDGTHFNWWSENDLHPADVDLMIARVGGLRQRGLIRGEVYDQVMASLRPIRHYARGTRRRLA